ncbi:MAG: hypothetical protein HY262_03675 [Chloroflexi bacterium]|nr:hypothetical protein [Chloroflexota bacterium]
MQFDLGPQGLGILSAFSLGFGVVAQTVGRSAGRWMWLVAAVGWFVGGLFMSEVMFATATESEIQPIIDGLAFDESLLGGVIVGTLAAIAAWVVVRGGVFHRPTPV